MPSEDINDSEINMTNIKKSKKNKFIKMLAGDNGEPEMSKDNISPKKAKKKAVAETFVEEINTRKLSEVKTKKHKLAEILIETINENYVQKDETIAKKSKKNKLIEISAEVMNECELSEPKTKKIKKELAEISVEEINASELSEPKTKKKKRKSKKNKDNNIEKSNKRGLSEEVIAKYPILNDEELYKKFMAVSLKNNQKGRMRQVIKENLQGTPEALLPDVLNNLMKVILKAPTLTDTALRKLRLLYNMLITAVNNAKSVEKVKHEQKPAIKVEDEQKPAKKAKENKKAGKDVENGADGETPKQKVKSPKRYVVFIGNLPVDISADKILEHFSDLDGKIKDVRIPKQPEEQKSAIAYLEVTDYLSFEFALSKHHTMLANKRINVLYACQQGSKITKTEAKGKTAKMVALQKMGKLAGSVPLTKKRSARRKKMKLAQKAEEAS